jgi:hypothetical protein
MSSSEFNLGTAMAGGNRNAARPKPDNEFHPTPVEAVDALMEREGGALRRYWKIWEPCCGNGAAAKALEFYKFDIVGTDLVDRGYGTGSLDFLKWQGEPAAKAIVTNPPFSLAVEFAMQAKALGVEYVAFLHKATFWHAADRDRLWAAWQPARIYALTFRLDFENLGSPTMECIWIIWDRKHSGETQYRRMSKAPPRGQLNMLGDGR